jgi:hypothetical protein
MKKISSLLVCALLFTTAMAQKKKIHIYLLAGQSNMAGRGTVEAMDTVINPHIWMLNKEELLINPKR